MKHPISILSKMTAWLASMSFKMITNNYRRRLVETNLEKICLTTSTQKEKLMELRQLEL